MSLHGTGERPIQDESAPLWAPRWARPRIRYLAAIPLAAAALAAWSIGALPTFVDETVVITTGWRLADGDVLYRDVFSHHFPLPYLWVGAMIDLAGPSLQLVRFSIWLLLALIATMVTRVTGFRWSIGLFLFSWTLIRVMYHGHMAMYVAWSGVAVWAMFVVCVSVLAGHVRWDKGAAPLVGVCAAVAMLSDPQSLYAVLLAGLILLGAGYRHALIAVSVAAGIALVTMGALAMDGALLPFVDQAITFNRGYSTRYMGMDPLHLGRLSHVATSLLGLSDPIWRDADPLRVTTLGYGAFDVWSFAGVIYRAALLAACMGWLLARRPLWAAWLYGFAVAAQANDTLGFRANGLAAIAVFVVAAHACGEWPVWRDGALEGSRRSAAPWRAAPWRLALPGPMLATSILAAIALSWVTLRAARFALGPERHAERMAQEAFENHEAERLKRMACRTDDVRLGYWPAGSATYGLTGFEPVAGYAFLWPWVAERGMLDIVDALEDDGVRAIVELQDVDVWGRWDTRDYLAPLRAVLDATYVRAGDTTWVSPALVEACRPASRKRSPHSSEGWRQP